MELTPQQAMQMAYQKRMQVLESVNEALKTYNQGRERQVELSDKEKSELNILSFGIAGAVLSFSPSSMENDLVLLGMAVLIFNAIVFGVLASWKQRGLNTQNFEDAIRDTQAIVRPYFDAYDALISKEPFDKDLWGKHQDAYIDYLQKQKEFGVKPRIAKRHILNIGEKYLWIFIAGFLFISIGLVQKYYFNGGDVTKVQIVQPREQYQIHDKKMHLR